MKWERRIGNKSLIKYFLFYFAQRRQQVQQQIQQQIFWVSRGENKNAFNDRV